MKRALQLDHSHTTSLLSMAMSTQSENTRPTSIEVAKRHLLLIDDDKNMAQMLAEYLTPEGFIVHLAYTARAGLERLNEGSIVLVILDVMLPDQDGFAVLKQIRQNSRVPIVMLTTKSSVSDKVVGLEGGADDYIPKPFTPIELLARIRTVLRRGQPTRFGSSFIQIDDLILDAGARTVERQGEKIDFTAAEYDVLQALASSAGEVLTREHLTRLALGRSSYAGDRGIDNLVSAVRKKLGPAPDGEDRVRSIRNAGYIFVRHDRPTSSD